MTKQQERDVLSQIETLIASTGNDSYIAMAFEGCVELAKTNIDNDWGCSMSQRINALEQQKAELEKDQQELTEQLAAIRARCETLIHTLDEARAQQNSLGIRKKVEKALQQDVDAAKETMTVLADQIADMAPLSPAEPELKQMIEQMVKAKEARLAAECLLNAFVSYK